MCEGRAAVNRLGWKSTDVPAVVEKRRGVALSNSSDLTIRSSHDLAGRAAQMKQKEELALSSVLRLPTRLMVFFGRISPRHTAKVVVPTSARLVWSYASILRGHIFRFTRRMMSRRSGNSHWKPPPSRICLRELRLCAVQVQGDPDHVGFTSYHRYNRLQR